MTSALRRHSPFFWNLIAKKYARDPVADQASYERKLDETRTLFRPDWHVLEVGCGTGTTALLHAPHVAHYLATDFSEKMISIARRKAEQAEGKVPDFAVATLEDLPEPERPFDAVLAMSLLHLVADLDGVLAHLRRQVRDGGYLITSTVCIGDAGGLMVRLLPLIGATGLLPKVLPIKADELLAAMERAGFAVERHWRPRPDASVFAVARAV